MSDDSNIVVGDSLTRGEMPLRIIRFVDSTELVQRCMSVDGNLDYREEAEKVYAFLQHWISCKTYDEIFRLMTADDVDSWRCRRVDGVCMADLYDGHDSIHELERTIHVLESVNDTWIEGCMPESVKTMVDNEIGLLRNKVNSMADDDTGEFV